MPLVVPGVCRFALNQSLEDRQVVNVLDMQIDTTGSTMDRNTAIFNQAGILINQWIGDIAPLVVDDLSLDSVSWVDLDAADGTTGSRVSSGGNTLPEPGLGTTDPLPANTAMLVTKQVQAARGRRNGRMYIAGIAEVATEPTNGNRMTPATTASRQTSMDSFLGNINQEDPDPAEFQSALAVVHVTVRDSSGNPLEGEFSVVQNLVVDQLLATQRRRLRG